MERGVLAPLKAGLGWSCRHTAWSPAAPGRCSREWRFGAARLDGHPHVAGQEMQLRRLKERARILRRLLRLRPWPLALAMLALGVMSLVATIVGWFHPAAAPAPVVLERAILCRVTLPALDGSCV